MEARPGDWECPDCGKVVFKSKSECFSCGAPKPAGLDDGFGGGGFGGSFGGGQKFEARPGDWECPECGKLVFKSKSECFSCGAPKPEGLDDGFGGGGFGGGQKLEARPGDWECPECGKLVFKSKSECFSCGAPKPAGLDDGFGGGGFGGSFGGGQKFEARPGDWECPECGKLVFKSKSECFSCGAPKPEGLDDGFGGGGFGGGQKLEARPGDWECPECGKLVFKSKSECFSCGAAKPEGLDDGFGGGGSGGGFGGGQKFEARPGDWECPECGKLVFRNKSECFSCGAPKPEGLDNGFGGGGSSYGQAPMCPLCACFLQGTSLELLVGCHSASSLHTPCACLTCLPRQIPGAHERRCQAVQITALSPCQHDNSWLALTCAQRFPATQVAEAGQATGAAPSASPPTLLAGEPMILSDFPLVNWEEVTTGGGRSTVQSVVHASPRQQCASPASLLAVGGSACLVVQVCPPHEGRRWTAQAMVQWCGTWEQPRPAAAWQSRLRQAQQQGHSQEGLCRQPSH